MIKEKNVVLSVILSIVTCGIYQLIWWCDITNDVDAISENPNKRSAGMVILLSIITCGLYSIYWWYVNGQLMEKAAEKSNVPTTSSAVLFLILSLVGFGIVNLILVQLDINKYAESAE